MSVRTAWPAGIAPPAGHVFDRDQAGRYPDAARPGRHRPPRPGRRPSVTGPALAVRVFAGRPEHSGQVRAWVRALAAVACPAAADDAELAAAELAATSIAHTRS